LAAVNDRPISEAALNGLYLGALGVPVGLVTGDDALADELADWLPWAERVVVKRGVSWQAADSLHPSKARALIRDGAERAVSRCVADDQHLRPLVLDPPLRLVIDLQNGGQADVAATIPGCERAGDRGVAYEAADAITLFRAFLSAVRLAGTADE
jgi:D-amino peptidase